MLLLMSRKIGGSSPIVPPSFLVPSTKSFFRIILNNNRGFRNHRPIHMHHTLPIPFPISKFCEAVNARDAHALSLALLVRELSLLNWSKNIFSYNLIPESFEKIINSVPSFRNPIKLTMKSMWYLPIMEQLGKLYNSSRCIHGTG